MCGPYMLWSLFSVGACISNIRLARGSLCAGGLNISFFKITVRDSDLNFRAVDRDELHPEVTFWKVCGGDRKINFILR